MKFGFKKFVLILFFIGLLGTPVVMRWWSARHNQNSVLDAHTALVRHGFYFQEVSQAAGVNFEHKGPTLDHKLDSIMPEVASMGAAVSIVDFDRDGWPDIYVTNSGEGSKNALYHNNHDGTFTDVAEQMGVADVNQPGTGVSMGAVWGDYDGDGKLDLFIGGYYSEKIDLWHLKNTQMMPESFEYAKNGGRKYLLRNLGGGKFEDVTEKVGIDSHRWALAAASADLRGS